MIPRPHALFHAATLLAICILLTACGGSQATNTIEDGKPYGHFDAMSKMITVIIKNKTYLGMYVTTSGANPVPGLDNGAPQPAFGAALSTLPGNSGRATLKATDGAALQCEFSFQGADPVGNCTDASGVRYFIRTSN